MSQCAVVWDGPGGLHVCERPEGHPGVHEDGEALQRWQWPARPTPAQQVAAGCADGHDPASATGICTRCGYDCMGYSDD